MFNKIYQDYIKRVIDLTLSLVALVVLSPVILTVALLVKLKLDSPVLFKQERPGLNDKIFTMYKFKTMTDGKDAKGNLLPDHNRLTKFGQFLRSTSLDELPELVNIIKGDMSIVGPRPLLVHYLNLYNEEQKRRHEVRPGLTGLAQVSGRNFLSWNAKFDLDVRYVEKLSFILDLIIVLKTVKSIISKEGVSAEGSATVEPFNGNERK